MILTSTTEKLSTFPLKQKTKKSLKAGKLMLTEDMITNSLIMLNSMLSKRKNKTGTNTSKVLRNISKSQRIGKNPHNILKRISNKEIIF